MVAILGVALALAGLAYVLARETSLFALRSVEVEGAQPALAASVRSALERFEGRSLVSLDPAAVERAVEALPMVAEASVDRRFPHALGVKVVPERPVAVARAGEESYLVSASGVVLGPVRRGALERLPRIWLPEGTELRPGRVFAADSVGALTSTLALVPRDFPVAVAAARGDREDVTLVLAGKTELRLGRAVLLGAKLRAAAAVLEHVRAAGKLDLEYLDVSLPTRPVAREKSQVESGA